MSRATVARVAAAVGPAAFGAASALGARKVDGYAPRDEPISALAASGSAAAPVMVGGFAVLGGATLVLGRALEGSRVPRVVARMMQITGWTTLAAGFARVSDRSCPTRAFGDTNVKPIDDAHAVASAATFTLWIAMPIVTAWRGTELDRGARAQSLVAGAVTLGAALRMGRMGQAGRERGGGVAQRTMVSCALAWFPVAARIAFDAPDAG